MKEKPTPQPAGKPRKGQQTTDKVPLAPAPTPTTRHRETFDDVTTKGSKILLEGPEVDANIILIAHPEGKMLGTRFVLSPGATLEIGRSPASEISLPDVLSISRNHARISSKSGSLSIEDLGSTNGTYVNDRLVEGRTVLQSGDRFQVGTVHFKLLHERDVEHAYHQAIYNLVMRDGLTEIFNKRKFEEEAQREFQRAKRYRRPLSVILFDLDHFKSINDQYGHLCGDFVLKQLAALAREMVRAEQVFARVGGEEFAILCPETGAEGAVALAEKLRQGIADHEFRYTGVRIPLSCSFGVAEVAPEMNVAQHLYEAADRALYASKNRGRNRVTHHSQPLFDEPS